MTPRDVLRMVEQKKVQFIDLRFMDFPGLWQHTTLPVSELTADSFVNGFGFDGSSIRGWQAINESDMLLVPVADTAKIDPFMQRKTISYLQKTKIADTAYFGPELEFFIFDHAFYDQGINFAKHYVGSREGIW